MAWVEVECPAEDCKGREVTHTGECRCKGTERVAGDEPYEFEDCPEEPTVIPHRWMAFHYNATFHRPSEWDASISCSYCGTDGELAE
jgi:hypothetical protein